MRMCFGKASLFLKCIAPDIWIVQSSTAKPVTKFCPLFNFKMVLEQNISSFSDMVMLVKGISVIIPRGFLHALCKKAFRKLPKPRMISILEVMPTKSKHGQRDGTKLRISQIVWEFSNKTLTKTKIEQNFQAKFEDWKVSREIFS